MVNLNTQVLRLNINKYLQAFNIRIHLQGYALVNIYIDGSVVVAHGGAELGQGLNTKMQQVCTYVYLNMTHLCIYSAL